MYYDNLADKRGSTLYLTWMRHLKKHSAEALAARLAAKHRDSPVTNAVYIAKGSFNHCYRVTFKDGLNVVVRLPALGRVSFRREQVENEASVMEFVARHTSIPIPQVLGFGTCAVGPYLVMGYIEGRLLSEYLAADTGMDGEFLNPGIDEGVLRKAYSQMAQILLELSKCQFAEVGAISQGQPGVWSVSKRPLTMNMNELVSLGNLPTKQLSQGPYGSAADYFEALAQEHQRHLFFQRNDAVDDEADCRRKYIARCLFLRIARRFPAESDSSCPFRLFCDDLRPSNVIVDADLNIRAVIDWDFCYAAPLDFTHCPPWWLLLAPPDGWADGLDDFFTTYVSRLEVFLDVLQDCESKAIETGTLQQSERLSEHMRHSMHSGAFWFCYAARSSYAFDEIYWRFIDPLYYGEFTSIEDRLKLLSPDEQADLETFVALKMQQVEACTLDEHQTLDEMINA